MNLLGLFGARGLSGNHTNEVVEEVRDDRSVMEYVDWFLQHMLQTSRMEMVVDSTKTLPDGGGTSKDPWVRSLPDIQAVINRLKVVSGLDPMPVRKPTDGRFERTRGTLVFAYETRFEDNPGSSCCRIKVRVRVGS
jgi:hypothetical protein